MWPFGQSSLPVMRHVDLSMGSTPKQVPSKVPLPSEFTAQWPRGSYGGVPQVKVAVPVTVPPLPGAEAVVVTRKPPPYTHVAMPVAGSIVATLGSEESHCAG